GVWRLSPGFDLTWNYNPTGDWTARHQMSVNGRRDGFALEDLAACARTLSLNASRARAIVAQVRAVVAEWPRFAGAAMVSDRLRALIDPTLRLELPAA